MRDSGMSSAEYVERLLRKAALSWLVGNPGAGLGLYSTTTNEFLHMAETAFFEARGRFQELSPPLPEREWGVYRLLDNQGRVIYVGMTGRPAKRVAEHYREFGERIREVVWEPHLNRVAALDAETVLIEELRPPLNLAKVPD